ncbi:MAG TPA: class I SAM-dependent methyltransferase [Bryobacteraceae bacterium]|nr:class I SAM-dependent methyltransferase [Bryobacteraceae bacterium]
MSVPTDEVWKTSALVAAFLKGVRGAIPLAGEQIDVMLRLLAASGVPIRRFLDLGCGDGILSAAIVERFPQAEAVLTDFSAPMLAAARARFEQLNTPARIVNLDYGVANWTESVNEFAPYDAVVSGYSIHHQPDERKREVYAEIFALLRPGGTFVNVEHVSSPSEWIESIHDELFVDHLHRAHPGASRAEVAEKYYYRPDKAANILAPVELQCEWLRGIGFTDVDCYLKIFELAVFGGRRPALDVVEDA